MALVDLGWYTSSVGFTAVTQWVKNTSFSAGALVRQTAPAVGSERVFVAVVGGKTVNSSEPVLTATRGAKTVDNTVTWQECTGQPGLNGDLTYTATWAQVKAAAPAVLGQMIQTTSGGSSLQICTTAGTMGAAEPTFSTTAGTTTGETSAVAVWTSLGAPSGFGILACPHGRIENALAATWGANGNIFLVADNHTQTVATSLTITLPSTAGLPAKLISFDHGISTAPPTASTAGASIAVSGNVGNLISGWLLAEGVVWLGGTTAGTTAQIGTAIANTNKQVFRNCSFTLRNTSATAITVGGTSAVSVVEFHNCTFTFAAASSQTFNIASGSVLMRNCTFTFGAQLTTLFTNSIGNRPTEVTIEGCDFSGTNYPVNLAANTLQCDGGFILKDCVLNASTALMAASPTAATATGIDLIRTDSGNTNYVVGRKRFEGDLTSDTTTVRTGGSSSSHKIATTSNASFVQPFISVPLQIWNSVTSGTVDITLFGAGAETPNLDDLWYDCEYLGNASLPLGSITTCSKTSFLAASVAWDTDGDSSWGGSPATKWKKTIAISPRQAGYVFITIRAAKASKTYYVDPIPVITGGPQVSRSSLGVSELFSGISRNRIGIGM